MQETESYQFRQPEQRGFCIENNLGFPQAFWMTDEVNNLDYDTMTMEAGAMAFTLPKKGTVLAKVVMR